MLVPMIPNQLRVLQPLSANFILAQLEKAYHLGVVKGLHLGLWY